MTVGPNHGGGPNGSANGRRISDVADAYLAAMAVDAGASMVTSDRGFARFPGLRTVDPTPA